MFTKGQLVECIDNRLVGDAISVGAIYTVYRSTTGKNLLGEKVDVVRLYEAKPNIPGFDAFYASLFRPLQDSRLDVFRAMLVQTPAPVFVHNGDDGA